MALAPKDTAPAFALKNDAGETVRLSQFKGKQVILYFYPAAMTPGCKPAISPITSNYSASLITS